MHIQVTFIHVSACGSVLCVYIIIYLALLFFLVLIFIKRICSCEKVS